MDRVEASFSSGFPHVFLRRLFKTVYYFSVSGFPHPWALHLTSSSLTFQFQLLDFSLLEILFPHQYVCFYGLIPCSYLKFISFFEMFSLVMSYDFHKLISSLCSSDSPFSCLSLTGLCFLVCFVIFFTVSHSLYVEFYLWKIFKDGIEAA